MKKCTTQKNWVKDSQKRFRGYTGGNTGIFMQLGSWRS